MGASNTHELLVTYLLENIRNYYANDHTFSLYSDCSLFEGITISPLINEYRPDVYGREIGGDIEIIGEAKTSKDLEKPRSITQITSFIEYLEKAEKGIFFLAVPWHRVPTAKNMLRCIRLKLEINNVVFRVLEKLPG